MTDPVPALEDPFRGTPYRSLERLRRRRMTEIHKVDGPAGRCLAKILRPEFIAVPQAVDRMRLDADILAALSHPNVVRLYDRGTTPVGCPYLILERLYGRSLRRESFERGALPVSEAVGLVLQALDGIAAVHRLGVVHRDLKLDNLFLSRTKAARTLKILDFGFAKVIEMPGRPTQIAPLATSTPDRKFVGSHRFAAPEEVAGRTVDHRADLYSLALVLYTLVYGREPFHDIQDRNELARAQLEGSLYPPSSETAERVSKDFSAIILKAANKLPEARFSSAEEFAAELQRFAEQGEPTQRAPMRMLTVKKHAQMTAEIELDPDRIDEIRAAHGLTSPGQLRAVEKWWRDNIGTHPNVRTQWRVLVDVYARRLRRSVAKKS